MSIFYAIVLRFHFFCFFTTQVPLTSSPNQTESGSTPVNYKIKKIYPDHFVPNLILYKTVKIKIRDYFALATSFKLKNLPYRIVAYSYRAL